MRRQQVLEGEGGLARSELAELEGKYGVARSQLAELEGQYERISIEYERISLEYERMASLCQTLQSKVCMCVVFVEVVVSRCVCVAVVSTACVFSSCSINRMAYHCEALRVSVSRPRCQEQRAHLYVCNFAYV